MVFISGSDVRPALLTARTQKVTSSLPSVYTVVTVDVVVMIGEVEAGNLIS